MKDDKPDNYPTLFLVWCAVLVGMLFTTCAGHVLEVTANTCKCQPDPYR